jgi:hypothetical protein
MFRHKTPQYKLSQLVFVMIIAALATLPITSVLAATSSEIVPTGNGIYTAWTGDYTDVDEGTGAAACGNGDSITSGTTNDRESVVISLSSIPDGSTITSIDVLARDRGDSAADGTYATFVRFNGSDSANSAVHTVSGTTGGCSGSRTDTFDVTDTVKTGSTTLEIGVVKTSGNTNAVRVGVLSAQITFIPSTTTSVSCTPNPVTYGSGTSCTATVTRNAGTNTPTGTVTWSLSGGDSGSFSAGTCNLSGSGASASCSVTYTPSSVGDGTHGITAAYGGDSNFNGGNGSQNVTVNKKALTITGITANNKVYDGTTAATISGTPSLAGVVGGDTVNITGTPTATFVNKNVGTGKTVNVTGYTLSGADADNYTLTSPTLTANITAKGLTVSGITANNKVYDGNATATLNTGSAALVGVIGGDTVTLNTGSAVGAFSNANIGTGKTVTVSGLTITGADAGNYSLTQPTTTADITAKALTVSGITANNKV